jgi:hypothetical protein
MVSRIHITARAVTIIHSQRCIDMGQGVREIERE